jgi:hypothetical protein
MKKLLILLPLLLVLLLAGHAVYDRKWNVAPAGDAALQALGGEELAAAFTPKSDPLSLLGPVRSEEGNAGVELDLALKENAKDHAAGLSRVEAAGAKRESELIPALWPVPPNPSDLPMPNSGAFARLGKLAAAKARGLEEAGDVAGAEREWRLLLSAGNHLQQELALSLAVLGIIWQKEAADGLRAHYEQRGLAAEAAACGAYAADMDRLGKIIKSSYGLLGGLALSDRGRAELRKLLQAPRALRSLKAEAAFANSTQHLYYATGRTYGPGRGQRKLHESFETAPDAGLQDWAKKHRRYLDMGFGERMRSVEKAAVLR